MKSREEFYEWLGVDSKDGKITRTWGEIYHFLCGDGVTQNKDITQTSNTSPMSHVSNEEINNAAAKDLTGGSSTGDIEPPTPEDLKSVQKCAFVRGAKWGLSQNQAQIPEIFKRVAASEDNEGTDSPLWFLIDPRQNMRADIANVASQFVGPWFSREAAETYLKNRRYQYGPKAAVWCASAYWSRDYKELYKASKALLGNIKDQK